MTFNHFLQEPMLSKVQHLVKQIGSKAGTYGNAT